MDSDNSKSKNKKEEIDISKEVNDLPIGALISGPLKAVVDAQKNMADYTFKAFTDKKNKVSENTKTNNE